MKYMKSKAAYTNKWLNRNRHLWEEKVVRGINIIILKTKCAPKIVVERVKEINTSRREKNCEVIYTALRNLVGEEL